MRLCLVIAFLFFISPLKNLWADFSVAEQVDPNIETFTCPDCSRILSFAKENIDVLDKVKGSALTEFENLELDYLITNSVAKKSNNFCSSGISILTETEREKISSSLPMEFVLSSNRDFNLNELAINQISIESLKEKTILRRVKLKDEDMILRIDFDKNGVAHLFWYKKLNLKAPVLTEGNSSSPNLQNPQQITLPPAVDIRKLTFGIDPEMDFQGNKSITTGIRYHRENGVEREITEVGYFLDDKTLKFRPFVSEDYSHTLIGNKFNFRGKKFLEGKEYSSQLSDTVTGSFFNTTYGTSFNSDNDGKITFGKNNQTNFNLNRVTASVAQSEVETEYMKSSQKSQSISLNQQDFSVSFSNSDNTVNGQKTNTQIKKIVFRPVSCSYTNPMTKTNECKNNDTDLQVTLTKIENDRFESRKTDISAHADGYGAEYSKDKNNYTDVTKIKLIIKTNNGETISLAQAIEKANMSMKTNRELSYSSRDIIVVAAQQMEPGKENYVLTFTKPINRNSSASISYDTKGELNLLYDLNYGPGGENMGGPQMPMPSQMAIP